MIGQEMVKDMLLSRFVSRGVMRLKMFLISVSTLLPRFVISNLTLFSRLVISVPALPDSVIISSSLFFKSFRSEA